MRSPISLILLLGFSLVRVASASTYTDDFPAALSNYVYGGWQGPFGDGTAGRLFPTADGTGIYMDATYNGYAWALRSSPEFSDADMTVRFVLPNRDNTEADWFGLWMLAHNPTTPPGGSCTTVCPFIVPESGLWLQFRVGFNKLVVTRFTGGAADSSTTVPLPLVALNQPHDARAVYHDGSLVVYLDGAQLLTWPVPVVPAGQVGFEVYRTDMIVDSTNIVGTSPPTLASIANMTVAPGTTADQGISAADPDADAITFTSSGPSFMTLTQDAQVGTTCTGNIHLAPSIATSGTFQASVTATANSQFDDQSFVITAHTNSPPTLNQPASMTVNEGATSDQVLTGSDPDGDALTFTKVAGPTFMIVTTISPTTGNVHLAPGFADAGTDPATVRTSDGALSADESFAITVNDVPAPPVLATIADMVVAPGATADQGISATDPDGDAITFTSSGPTFMALTSNAQVGDIRTGNIHLAPPLGTSGTFQASVTASAKSQFDDQGFVITVSSDRAPTLIQPANMTVSEGATADQVITGTDPDGSAVMFSEVSGPTYMAVTTVTPGTGTGTGNIHLAPGFSDAGTAPATVRVSDGSLSDDKSFTITIGQCHSAPILAQPANMVIAQGATADQVISASDACGNAVTFTKVAGPTFMTVTTTNATTGNIHLAPGFADNGTFGATVRASDGLANSDKSFTITVNNVNRAPTMAQPASMTVSENATADQTLTAFDPDGNPLTFSKVAGPLFMTVTTTAPGTGTATGNIHVSPGFSDTGTYSATVRASDGVLTDTKSFGITVNHVNRPPTANAGGPYSGVTGVAITFNGSGSSDPDRNALTFAWTFGDGGTGAGATPTHTYTAAGTYEVCLTVTDNGSPPLSDTKCTTATIGGTFPARVFRRKANAIQLSTDGQRHCFQIEPIGGDFAPNDINPSSIVMKYGATQVSPTPGKSVVIGDTDNNGIMELRTCFSAAALRTLFAAAPLGVSIVTVSIEGDLTTGGRFQGDVTFRIQKDDNQQAAALAPNPLNPDATLTFATSKPGSVKVEMFDLQGRLVRTILNESFLQAGYHEVTIDGRGQRGEKLASGVYFARGVTADGTFKISVTILK